MARKTKFELLEDFVALQSDIKSLTNKISRNDLKNIKTKTNQEIKLAINELQIIATQVRRALEDE